MIIHSVTPEGAEYIYNSGYIYDVFGAIDDRPLFCIQSPQPIPLNELSRITQAQTYASTYIHDIRTFVRG